MNSSSFSYLMLIVFSTLFISCGSTKNNEPISACETYTGDPSEIAELLGGVQSLYRSLRFPASMKGFHKTGEVFAVYHINTEGKIDKVVIQSATSQAFADEVLRVSRSLRFKPAKNNGQPVCSMFAIPVRFRG